MIPIPSTGVEEGAKRGPSLSAGRLSRTVARRSSNGLFGDFSGPSVDHEVVEPGPGVGFSTVLTGSSGCSGELRAEDCRTGARVPVWSEVWLSGVCQRPRVTELETQIRWFILTVVLIRRFLPSDSNLVRRVSLISLSSSRLVLGPLKGQRGSPTCLLGSHWYLRVTRAASEYSHSYLDSSGQGKVKERLGLPKPFPPPNSLQSRSVAVTRSSRRGL